MSISPNMSLVLPAVGVTPGPEYATQLNSSLTIIDQHDHSAGSGVAITPSGLNINADLPFAQNNATALRSTRFFLQSSPLALSTDIGCLYASGVDLYYNDGLGNQVRITQSGGVAGSPGSIASLTSPASATYVSANQTFVWQSAALTPANLDAGSVIFRNIAASSQGVTVSAPASLASSYSLTLPALPASQKFVTLDASGNLAAPWTVDNSGIEVSSNTVQLKNGGIVSSKLASDLNIPGFNVKVGGSSVISSNTNATAALQIVRIYWNGSVISIGEGATVNNPGTGTYEVTFTTPFAEPPVSVVSAVGFSNRAATVNLDSASKVTIQIRTADSATAVNSAFCLVCVGQRA